MLRRQLKMTTISDGYDRTVKVFDQILTKLCQPDSEVPNPNARQGLIVHARIKRITSNRVGS